MEKSVAKINKICEKILALTEDDFNEVREIAEAQQTYISPFKPVTTKWQNDLGDYNFKVVRLLQELQDHLKTGADIKRP